MRECFFAHAPERQLQLWLPCTAHGMGVPVPESSQAADPGLIQPKLLAGVLLLRSTLLL